jgi:hypothetical protein
MEILTVERSMTISMGPESLYIILTVSMEPSPYMNLDSPCMSPESPYMNPGSLYGLVYES